MQFKFCADECSDVGLIVRHGNQDNVVLFFDENPEAACYQALLFRTDAVFPMEGFLEEARIEESKVTRRYSEIEIISTRILNKSPVYQKEELVVPKSEQFDRDAQKTIYSIERMEFDTIKFITCLESSRNNLYINITFLPIGQYFVILNVEGRSGETIETSLPYYFKVEKQKTNGEMIEAIGKAGRSAGRASVHFG